MSEEQNPVYYTVPNISDEDIVQALQDIYRHGKICLPPGTGLCVIGWDETRKKPVPIIATKLNHPQLRALLKAILVVYAEGKCQVVKEGEDC